MDKDNARRLNSLVDSLCRSNMYDAANKHMIAVATFPLRDEARPHDANYAYHDFLEGWRAAMSVTFPELLEENEQLHGIVMDLCTRLMVRRCDACKGNRVDDNLEDCPSCDGQGYIKLPKGKAERVVRSIIKKEAR